ncbi:Caspase-1, partial [Stegodyphus mimosarum]
MAEAMDEGGLGDNIDAKGIFGKDKPPSVEAVLSGLVDSPDYCMDFPKRGKCYIFNHKNFEPQTGLNVRNGTDADATRLYCRFRELGFDVSLFTNLKSRDVLKELQKVAKEDHSKNSCFVCCVLSHGESGILYGSDGKYETERIFAPFRGDVCPTLTGKPKIFFIQACQGDKLDHGVSMKCQIATDSSSIQEETYRIPTHADFLIVYSTVSGFYSWRNTTNGSWFIQALCAALQDHAKDMDLLGLLTIVNRKVAYDFESFTPQDNSMHLKKQVPCVTSTLTRNIKFS